MCIFKDGVTFTSAIVVPSTSSLSCQVYSKMERLTFIIGVGSSHYVVASCHFSVSPPSLTIYWVDSLADITQVMTQ